MSEQAVLNSKYVGYADYKDSGVEWLGAVPEHWSRAAVWMKFSLGRGRVISNEEIADNQGLYPVYSSQTLDDGVMGYIDSFDFEGEYITWTTDGANAGTVFARKGKFNCTNVCGTLKAHKSEESFYRYYAFALSVATSWFVRHDINPKLMNNVMSAIRIPVPSIEEQRTIAAFLDYETARIDSLIDKQQRLIELLKEKRQAVISHAVTKGLNPDAPMKDSGVEWLGQVPEHWVVSRIKNYAKIDSGHTPSRQVEEYWIDCNIPWVSLNDSKTLKIVDYLTDTKHKISELGMANSSAHLLPAHSVVFTRDASIGLSAILDKPMAVSQHLIAWICDHTRLLPEFLLLAFYAMEKEFERYTFGATIKTIGMDDVRSLTAAFPPLTEQSTIAKWAFEKMSSLDKGIVKAESVVGILRERRTALISAAVTGKIDLRGWTPPREG